MAKATVKGHTHAPQAARRVGSAFLHCDCDTREHSQGSSTLLAVVVGRAESKSAAGGGDRGGVLLVGLGVRGSHADGLTGFGRAADFASGVGAVAPFHSHLLAPGLAFALLVGRALPTVAGSEASASGEAEGGGGGDGGGGDGERDGDGDGDGGGDGGGGVADFAAGLVANVIGFWFALARVAASASSSALGPAGRYDAGAAVRVVMEARCNICSRARLRPRSRSSGSRCAVVGAGLPPSLAQGGIRNSTGSGNSGVAASASASSRTGWSEEASASRPRSNVAIARDAAATTAARSHTGDVATITSAYAALATALAVTGSALETMDAA